MTYTYKKNKPFINSDIENSVIRKEDNATIPFDPANIDYQEYLAWVAEGNTADAAD